MASEFFDAIRDGNREQVEHFLRLDSELIHAQENGPSPILVAAYHMEPALADFLAEKTMALNIFEAAAIGRTTHLVRLLARQPDLVNAYADDGFQPLGLACFFGHAEAAEYLVRAGATVNSASKNDLHVVPLQSAAAGRHASIVKMLLKAGAQPTVRERGGFTPLHAAAEHGDVEILQMLIFAGADLQSKSDNGLLPVDIAEAGGHTQAVALLKNEITKRFRASSG